MACIFSYKPTYEKIIKMFANIDVFHKLIRNRDNNDMIIPKEDLLFKNRCFTDDYFFYPKFIYSFDNKITIVWLSYKVRTTHDYIRKMLKKYNKNYINIQLARYFEEEENIKKKYDDKFSLSNQYNEIPDYEMFMDKICELSKIEKPDNWRQDCMELSQQICNQIKEKVIPIPQEIPYLDYKSGYDTI